MQEYQAVFVYAGLMLFIFLSGLAWNKYRKNVKRKFRMINYHSSSDTHDHKVNIA